jgi:DeoR/GlpR family transcriptional regulator of sugar metabolism
MVTLRRDLKDLEKENLIRLEHGSAVALNYLIGATREPRFEAKRLLNSVSKRKLAAKAIEFIKTEKRSSLTRGPPADTSPCPQQKRYNNLILLQMTSCLRRGLPELLHSGDRGRRTPPFAYYNSYGSYSEEMLSNLRADKFFLSGDAVSIDWGISNISMEEVPVKKKMIEISDKVILIADGSKFDTNAPHRICQWDTIDAVITETTVGEKYRRLFEDLKLETYYDE